MAIRRCCCRQSTQIQRPWIVGPTGPMGPQGMRGPTGPTGPTGATGETGTISNQNATILNTGDQALTSGTAITMSTVLTNNELTVADTTITATESGTYVVGYSVNKISTDAGASSNVALSISGNINANTQRPLSTTSPATGVFVLNLTAGQTIALVPTITTPTTLQAANGPSASLTVVRIS